MNLIEILIKRFKVRIEERKLFLEHQLRADPTQEHPRLIWTVLGSIY